MSFFIPERLRIRNHPILASDETYGNNGAFKIESPEPGWTLFFVASDEGGWEHVSVHAHNPKRKRVPNWKEMCFMKDLCWGEDDVVIQYHPAKSDYVNVHPYTLHLWRPTTGELPIPEKWMV